MAGICDEDLLILPDLTCEKHSLNGRSQEIQPLLSADRDRQDAIGIQLWQDLLNLLRRQNLSQIHLIKQDNAVFQIAVRGELIQHFAILILQGQRSVHDEDN